MGRRGGKTLHSFPHTATHLNTCRYDAFLTRLRGRHVGILYTLGCPLVPKGNSFPSNRQAVELPVTRGGDCQRVGLSFAKLAERDCRYDHRFFLEGALP